MPESCDVEAQTRDEIYRISPLKNRLEQLRGEYLRIPTWKMPFEKQLERFKTIESQRKSLESQVSVQWRTLSEPSRDMLKACRDRLRMAAQEAKKALGIED